MATITVPRSVKVGERNLVAVPQEEYRVFLNWQKMVKSQSTFRPTKADKQALERGRKNLSKGQYIELAQLRHELGNRRR